MTALRRLRGKSVISHIKRSRTATAAITQAAPIDVKTSDADPKSSCVASATSPCIDRCAASRIGTKAGYAPLLASSTRGSSHFESQCPLTWKRAVPFSALQNDAAAMPAANSTAPDPLAVEEGSGTISSPSPPRRWRPPARTRSGSRTQARASEGSSVERVSSRWVSSSQNKVAAANAAVRSWPFGDSGGVMANNKKKMTNETRTKYVTDQEGVVGRPMYYTCEHGNVVM
ncbi:hypothetical protein G3M48_009734 [Beauveria asiatica]|uniref:Uncharacterized protein n=1 Tax=Beauveria asiatica TaxID=1069075 RepID=A0AAW0RI53_9HYPO